MLELSRYALAAGTGVLVLAFLLSSAALFVSAGGYHHHMAMNTWQSAGVGLRAPGLGLGRVDIALPDADSVAATAERLRGKGLDVRLDGGALEVDDPWGNVVRVAA